MTLGLAGFGVGGSEHDWDRTTAAVIDISAAPLGHGSVRCDARQGIPHVLEASKQALFTLSQTREFMRGTSAALVLAIPETSISSVHLLILA
jgi:hypothetical protein